MEYKFNEPATLKPRLISTADASRQTYSVHRDGQLLISNHPALTTVKQFVRTNARHEKSAGRTASYIVTGTSGFRCVGVMDGKMVRWD